MAIESHPTEFLVPFSQTRRFILADAASSLCLTKQMLQQKRKLL